MCFNVYVLNHFTTLYSVYLVFDEDREEIKDKREPTGGIVRKEDIMSLMADARSTKGGRIYGGHKGMVHRHVLKEDEEPYASTVLFLRIHEGEIKRRCAALNRDPNLTFKAIDNHVSDGLVIGDFESHCFVLVSPGPAWLTIHLRILFYMVIL